MHGIRTLMATLRRQYATAAATPPWTPEEDEATAWIDGAEDQARLLRDRPDPDRWREVMVVTTSPEHDEAISIVGRLWAAPLPLEFRMLATALVQVRIEDRLPVPTDPDDPLRREVEAMVTDQLRRETTRAS